MAYKKLSEQVRELSNPQRSDTFVKLFRGAVREGKIEAAYIQERFSLPKAFSSRKSGGSYSKDSRDMIFEVTPAFEAWFQDVNRELAPARSGGKIKPTVENIEAGLVDFKALAEQTRQKLHASYNKGHQLGVSRSGQGGARRPGRPKKK